MLRFIRPEEREIYNQAVDHPLQSWEWGEFREKTGLALERLGFFENGKLTNALQMTFHPIPILGGTAGYLPKAFTPNQDQLIAIKQVGEKHHALFVKLEPNTYLPAEEKDAFKPNIEFLEKNQVLPGRPLFSRHTFFIDLKQDEETLFANLSPKARYNVRLAIKKGVKIFEDSTQEGLDHYLKILNETTKRQNFYAHGPDYFKTMWQVLKPTGMMKIFHAIYQQTILVSWVMFVFHDRLYYPYGASSDLYREVMASNLMLWEMIKFGQANKLKTFDLWGALAPNADPKHPWYGFHRFKASYGGKLMVSLGSYDCVIKPSLYPLFRYGEKIRWKVLRLRAKLKI